MRHTVLPLILFFLIPFSSPVHAEEVNTPPLALSDGDRILFLGDSIVREGSWWALAERLVLQRFPDLDTVWLNAGISGDTAHGALRRLDWDVLPRDPTLVVLMMGMNDVQTARYLPGATPPTPEEERELIDRYASSMADIVRVLTSRDIKVVLCTPTPYGENAGLEAPAAVGANRMLAACARLTRDLAAEHGLPLVDFFDPMRTLAREFQQTNPSFTLIGDDRVHPGPMGRAVMAHLWLTQLRIPGIRAEQRLRVDDLEADGIGGRVENLRREEGHLRWEWRPEALPLAMSGGTRRAAQLVPFGEDVNHSRLRVDGLTQGWFELLINGGSVGTWHSQQLEEGVDLATLRDNPRLEAARELRRLHRRRHQRRSIGPRMKAFVQHFTLPALGLAPDAPDAEATAALEDFLKNDAPADTLATGSYARAMVQRSLPNWETLGNGAPSPALRAEIDALRNPVPLRMEIRPPRHPVSETERLETMRTRREPEALENLADDFLGRLGIEAGELRRTGLRFRPGLVKVSELHRQGKSVEAMEAFRDYVFHKLRTPNQVGLPPGALDPYQGLIRPGRKRQTLEEAERLMRGKLRADAPPTPPGTVFLPPAPPSSVGSSFVWTPDRFRPLVEAYLLTGERRFLDRWADYLDDWALHDIFIGGMSPTGIGDRNSNVLSLALDFHRALAGIARLQPAGERDFPADTLARVLTKLNRDCLPLSLVYHESNPQNWTPGGTANLLLAIMLMDEFRSAEHLFNRALARHENYGTLHFLPDGSETEHALWYNAHYFDGALKALRLARSRGRIDSWKQPLWERRAFTPFWEGEQERKINERARFFLQMLTPQREYPIGNRSDQRKLPDWKSRRMIEYAIRNGGAGLRVIMNTLMGNRGSGAPPFTASAFPYGGHWLMREGWDSDSGYGHFFSSPYPTGGHALRGLKSNNGFWLSEAGQDLLVAGGYGNYSYDRSPLRVDGQEAFAHAGIANPGINKSHKGFAVGYVDPSPPDWRFHSSERFDFTEGVYDGPYGFFVDDHHDDKDYRVGFLAERARQALVGVRHHRQVAHLKSLERWVVIDRIHSDAPRDISIDWRLPLELNPEIPQPKPPPTQTVPFRQEEIELFPGQGRLLTRAENRPNLSIRAAGPGFDLTRGAEDAERIQHDYTLRYRMHDFMRVAFQWRQAAGAEVVVSLVEALPDGRGPLADWTPFASSDGVRGWTARHADGTKTTVRAARTPPARLEIDDVTAEAELLLVLESAEHLEGILLGAVSLRHQGGPVELPHKDLEFRLDADGWSFTPIHPPIEPVEFLPNRTVFQSGEAIRLQCATPGVEIRYTLDGSDPLPDSPLYTGPVPVLGEATLRARAFRPGLSRLPETPAGTHATPDATARVSTMPPLPAVAASGLKPGLLAREPQGDWRDLVFFPEILPSGDPKPVRAPFERLGPNPRKVVNRHLAGFLNVPETGVYTFHFPRELVNAATEAGYALRLFLGRERLPNGRESGRLNEWIPTTTRHAYGTWSVALEAGPHPFELVYVDYRTDARERWNHPGLRQNLVWDGEAPALRVTPPGQDGPVSIPADWYRRK